MPLSALEYAPQHKDAFLENLVEDVVAETVFEDVPIQVKVKDSKPKPMPIEEQRLETAISPKFVVYPRRRPPRLPANLSGGFNNSDKISRINDYPAAKPKSGRECDMNTKRIVEAILFAAGKPMTVKQIQQVFPEIEQPDTLEIQDAIESISQDYFNRPIGLKQLASGYRFQVKEGMAYWVSRVFEEKPARYSRALLETIAIIAYRQPVTRGEIEDIRGVAVSSGIIHTLLEREWIRIIAHKEAPGRPALYGTTKQFLDYFNLSSLTGLPTLEELANLDVSKSPEQQTQQVNSERPQAADSFETADLSTAEQKTG